MHFTVNEAGLIKINLDSPEALTIKAGNVCNTETFFRSGDKTTHAEEFRVSAGEVINISMFDWTTGGGYDYTLGIEFVSDGGGVTPPPTDTIAPVITLLGANPLNLQVGDTFTDPGATADDNVDGDITDSIVPTSNVNTAIAGSYTVVYDVSDGAGNSAGLTRSVVVSEEPVTPPPGTGMTIDTDEAANLNCPGDTITEINNLSTSFNESATGSMKFGWDVDRMHFTVNEAGLIKINLDSPEALTIKVGNVCNTETFFRSGDKTTHAEEFRVSAGEVINISMFDWTTGGGYDYTLGIEFVSDGGGVTPPPTDITPPVITLNGANPLNLTVGDTFIDPGAAAVDNVDGDITASIVATSNVNTAIAGSYTVVYDVSDTAGNSASLTRSVVVSEEPPPVTYTKEQLGELLFSDENLSFNRTQSCATCHNPEHAFIDNRTNSVGGAVSLGDDGISLGDRNSPTAAYAMFNPDFHFDTVKQMHIGGQFFDGRAKDLKAQAEGPPVNPVEMGMPDKESVVNRLKENSEYETIFKALYGDNIFDDTNASYAAMAESIAKFEKTDEFAPFDSKYDRYLNSEYVLSAQEELGMDLFFSEGALNCTKCHVLKTKGAAQETFTNYEYHNIGTPINHAVRLANGSAAGFIDHGLLDNPDISDIAHDGKFKVPTLRNIAVTGPYMHNGVFKNLKTVMEFYDQFNNPDRNINPETGEAWDDAEVSTTVNHVDLAMPVLTDEKIDALVAFLKTLTDEKYEHLITNEPDPDPDPEPITIDNEPGNGECPGELINILDGALAHVNISANGTMKTSWDIDRYRFTPQGEGTLKISLLTPELTTIKAGTTCNQEQFFRSSGKTQHYQEFRINAGQSIYLSMFDWESNGYTYQLDIEFIPDNAVLTANAGSDITVTEKTTATLNGSSNMENVNYAWTQTSGTPIVSLTGANTAEASFTAPEVSGQTHLEFTLTITDNLGNSDTDNIVVTINPTVGLDTRPDNNSCYVPNRPGEGGNINELRLGYEKLSNSSFSAPIALLQAPNDNDRWYVVEKHGTIKTFQEGGSVSTFANIQNIVNSQYEEQGLLGMAFHPEFPTKPYLYLYYINSSGNTVVSRFTSSNGLTMDTSSEQIILRVNQPYSNHNGGQIAFGLDGYLYIGLGDGGSANDPHDNGQNTKSLLGSMLRIDVDNGTPYSIPSDNPFTGNSLANNGSCSGDCPEIWAWGLRNPWRWSFDKANGKLWAGDVGQNAWEEVSIIEKGKNYGWRCKEGFHTTGNGCSTSGFTDPVVEYGHNLGFAITGGYVYRGNNIPALKGTYVYADYVTGRIWGYTSIGQNIQFDMTNYYISAFGQGNDGELYVVDYAGGSIYRIIATSGANSGGSFPQTLSQTGCFNGTQPTSSLIPYDINVPLWSDALDKHRWFALANNSKITLDADKRKWVFPIGSVLFKEFRKDGKRIETRMMVHHDDGEWGSYSYEWDANDDDAALVDINTGKSKDIGGGQTWVFPSEAQCFRCHTSAADFVLGPETAQMNKEYTYPLTGKTANQLTTYEHIGLFNAPLNAKPSELDALTNTFDTNTPLEKRARDYLHSNCSGCHLPGGGTPASMDLRYHKNLAEANICNSTPLAGNFGISGAKLIVPGDSASSILSHRIGILGEGRMSPLGTYIVDNEGLGVVNDWINSLTECP